jgi:hypothetical protein
VIGARRGRGGVHARASHRSAGGAFLDGPGASGVDRRPDRTRERPRCAGGERGGHRADRHVDLRGLAGTETRRQHRAARGKAREQGCMLRNRRRHASEDGRRAPVGSKREGRDARSAKHARESTGFAASAAARPDLRETIPSGMSRRGAAPPHERHDRAVPAGSDAAQAALAAIRVVDVHVSVDRIRQHAEHAPGVACRISSMAPCEHRCAVTAAPASRIVVFFLRVRCPEHDPAQALEDAHCRRRWCAWRRSHAHSASPAPPPRVP